MSKTVMSPTAKSPHSPKNATHPHPSRSHLKSPKVIQLSIN
ncbi:hypothetical protein [Rubritalea tangerina]